jgi:hypothetical protein
LSGFYIDNNTQIIINLSQYNVVEPVP